MSERADRFRRLERPRTTGDLFEHYGVSTETAATRPLPDPVEARRCETCGWYAGLGETCEQCGQEPDPT